VLIENEFTASAPVDELWAFLLDVQRIAPCMPGAELTEVVDDRTWKGRMTMKFGPVGMAFAGTVTMQERDDAAHRVVLSAKGTEQKGKGAASASVTSWLEPRDDGSSLVKMQADISLTGAVAQLSRGLLPEVSKKLTQQFADCLEQTLAASQPPTASAPAAPRAPAASDGTSATATSATPSAPAETTVEPPPTTPAPMAAKPVGGIGLGLSALWAVVKNFFRRLFGGARSA
jgi:carbon monoxide dehydrogenase subunit G